VDFPNAAKNDDDDDDDDDDFVGEDVLVRMLMKKGISHASE
jgi:hypothetical protein